MTEISQLSAWLDAFRDALAKRAFVGFELRKPSPLANDLKAVDARLIMARGVEKISFTYHHKTHDIVKNHAVEESVALLEELLTALFQAARLYTIQQDVLLSRQGEKFVLSTAPATHTSLPELTHNRAKVRLIETAGKAYLHRLGLTDAQGQVHKNSQDKFRQINKYIEILDGLVKQLAPREVLHVVDMGAGKGYLTFALYDHLVNNLGLRAEVVGVELRSQLVTASNEIATSSGFTGLRFEQGSISQHNCTGADVVIALHACDTATDDAIGKAVKAQAELIVVAPCCHKQIRREMEKGRIAPELEFLVKYGTYAERLAEMVTDGMRAQLLELAGYRTNLFEFIGDAHTPKNVMIVATKLSRSRSAPELRVLEAAIDSTKTEFGIGHHYLEKLLRSANSAIAEEKFLI